MMFDGANPVARPEGDDYNLFTSDHEAFRESVRRFVEREIHPHVEEWEAAGEFPRELYERVGELGFFGVKFGAEFGGTGPDFLAAAVFIEELARCRSGGVAAGLGAHTDLASLYVGNFGTDEQRKALLTPSIEGKMIGALGVTEPDAGSDVAALRTKGFRDGGDLVINGTKTFITNGSRCDYVVTAVRTGGEGYGGISLVLVPTDAKGFSSKRIGTVGWRTSHTGELTFDDVRVPVGNILGGEEGQGFKQIMGSFAWERLAMSLGAVAAAQQTMEGGIAYARDRKVFGRELSRFQVWRHRFADMETEIEAARALTYEALRAYLLGRDDTIRLVSMAKALACEVDWRVADECLQVHGGYGYMMEFPVQRAWRDSRLGPIGGGTTQIMHEIIAKSYGL
jgi:acyl-CoA dehydrogenase